MDKQPKAAFTLIELLVVVLIIGILTAIAIPQYQKAVARSRLAAVKPLLQALKNADELYYLENGSYLGITSDIAPLIITSSCSHVQGQSVLKCDNYFLIDHINSAYGIVAAYCPGHQHSYNQGTDSCWYNTDFRYVVYLDHSPYPGIVTCGGDTDLGKAVCKSEKTL